MIKVLSTFRMEYFSISSSLSFIYPISVNTLRFSGINLLSIEYIFTDDPSCFKSEAIFDSNIEWKYPEIKGEVKKKSKITKPPEKIPNKDNVILIFPRKKPSNNSGNFLILDIPIRVKIIDRNPGKINKLTRDRRNARYKEIGTFRFCFCSII